MLLSYYCNHLYLFNGKKETLLSLKILTITACEQALWGTLEEGFGEWGEKGELATMSLEFEYLH